MKQLLALALGAMLAAVCAGAGGPAGAGRAEAEKSFSAAEARYFGRPMDCPGAVDLYKKAAEKGHAPAMYRLGEIYLSDACHGAAPRRPNNAEAVHWFRQAADRGVSGAMNDLGICYKGGLGVQRSPAEGEKWIRLAAERGDPQALMNLAGYGAGMKGSKAGKPYGGAEWLKQVREGSGDTPEQAAWVKTALEGRGDTVSKDESIRRFNNLTDYEWYQVLTPELGADLLTKEQKADFDRRRHAAGS